MDDWIRNLLEQFGALGVGLLMFAENVFPPIPSELVMPWAGYAVSQGKVSFLGVVVSGSLGSFAGALFWYFVAFRIGKERLIHWVDRHGWWLTLSKSEIQRTDAWFDRWGGWAVLICRVIPGVRTLISVPAGFSGMPLGRFSLFTAIGTVIWTTLLAGLGWWMGNRYSDLSGPLSWFSWFVIGGILAWWMGRLIVHTMRRRQRSEP